MNHTPLLKSATLAASLAVAGLAVSAVSVAAAEDVRLSSGDILTGEVIERTDETLTLQHPVLGRVEIPAADVEQVGLDLRAADAATAAAEAAEADSELSDPELAHLEQKEGFFGSPFLRGYDKKFTLGLTGSQGNSETLALFSNFDAASESDEYRTQFLLRYFLSEEDGERTRNDFLAQALRDWKFQDSKWFAFGQAQYQYDDFEPWLHRAGAFAGPGYQFVDRDDLQVLGRVGAGAIWEGGEVNEWTPEALIGLDVDWEVTDGQTLSVRNILYPSLDDFFENRNVTRVTYTIDLDQYEDGMIIQFGVDNEYESSTEGDFEHNDLKYFASVGLEF